MIEGKREGMGEGLRGSAPTCKGERERREERERGEGRGDARGGRGEKRE
jgi:hypothetical protein